MNQVKLSSLKDGKPFKTSARSKVTYTVVKKIKGGILVTSVLSQRTYTKKGKTMVIAL